MRDLIGTLAAAMMEDQLTRFAEGDRCQRVSEPASLDWRENGRLPITPTCVSDMTAPPNYARLHDVLIILFAGKSI